MGIVCVTCGSSHVRALRPIHKWKRPNGEPMIEYRCRDCGAKWTE